MLFRSILTQLCRKQLRLSIDNFGTRDFSLIQLRDLPFDGLKISPKFVHGVWNNEKLQEKFDSILGMAKQLGMKVVAVGVEDQSDWNLVRKMGCDIAQGYFISKPMPAPDLPGWIRYWETTKGIGNACQSTRRNT